MEAVGAWAVSSTAATVDDDRDVCRYDESHHDANHFERTTFVDHHEEDAIYLSSYAPNHRDASHHRLHHPSSTVQGVAVRTSIRVASTADPRRSSSCVFRDHRATCQPSLLGVGGHEVGRHEFVLGAEQTVWAIGDRHAHCLRAGEVEIETCFALHMYDLSLLPRVIDVIRAVHWTTIPLVAC